MSRFALVFAVALGFAIVSTSFAAAHLLTTSNATSGQMASQNGVATSPSLTFGAPVLSPLSHPSTPFVILQFFEDHSLTFAPSGWFLVGGLWIWRGRMKSRWEALGFDSEVFELFVRMRGGKTRVKLLNSLMMPKDRFQLAQELGMDWKAVNHHIMTLNKAGFVHEQIAYGRVRMYELTSIGKTLLQLLKDVSAEEGIQGVPGLPKVARQET